MNKTYERRALWCGLLLNCICAGVGIVFFFVTDSLSIFLDTLISIILCVSTIVSLAVSNASSHKPSEQYPLGKYAVENIFILFRSIMLLTTIGISIFSGVSTIVNFAAGDIVKTNLDNMLLIYYGVAMSLLCLSITVIYNYYNKKMNNKSSILRIELYASLFDGLVTIVAISSLLAFNNIPSLSGIAPIGDSITVIALALFYIYKPFKELCKQIGILTDRRKNYKEEELLEKDLKKIFKDLDFYDIYIGYSGNTYNIFITFLPHDRSKLAGIDSILDVLSNYIYEEFENSNVHLYCTSKKLHAL